MLKNTEVPKVKALIKHNSPFQNNVFCNYWCINCVFITLMLQLVNVELSLITSYTAAQFAHSSEEQ